MEADNTGLTVKEKPLPIILDQTNFNNRKQSTEKDNKSGLISLNSNYPPLTAGGDRIAVLGGGAGEGLRKLTIKYSGVYCNPALRML